MNLCVQSSDGRFTASGHENGSVYIFSNETGRMLHSLPGLIKPIRAISFSPANTLLAAAGDAKIIALYEVSSGEQVANLTGHGAWIFSLDWSHTGEYLLSGCVALVPIVTSSQFQSASPFPSSLFCRFFYFRVVVEERRLLLNWE